MNNNETRGGISPVECVGGAVVTDPEKKKTGIPPKADFRVKSVNSKEPVVVAKMEGPEWPPREEIRRDEAQGRDDRDD